MEKNVNDHFTDNLMLFLNRSPTPYQAVATVADVLEQNGYQVLEEGDAWTVAPGGKYYVARNQSALVAFAVGTGDLAADGFRIVASHTDSPAFKVKPGRCLVSPDGYLKLNVEAYGSAIYSTWFDRPLSLAGRVLIRSGNAVRPSPRLLDIREPVALIPNLAIHFNRQINSGYTYNVQADMLPLLGKAEPGTDGTTAFLHLLARALEVRAEDIVDYDMFLYEAAPGCRLGASGEYISASRIDNLASVFAGMDALIASSPFPGVRVMAAFDNEEVGNATRAGADGSFLPCILERIALGLGLDAEGVFRAVANSKAISADAAHAVHPNYPERHDPENRPILGGGPTIKYSAQQRYATDAVSGSVFARICESAGIPVQKFANRSDSPGGSTLGPALSKFSSIPTVDVGVPLLAMHSIRELANASDIFFMVQAFQHFYSYMGK